MSEHPAEDNEPRIPRRAIMFLPACIAAALTIGLGWTFLDWLLHVEVDWWLMFKVAGFLFGVVFGVAIMVFGAAAAFWIVFTAADSRRSTP
jgi:hypothetical protein